MQGWWWWSCKMWKMDIWKRRKGTVSQP